MRRLDRDLRHDDPRVNGLDIGSPVAQFVVSSKCCTVRVPLYHMLRFEFYSLVCDLDDIIIDIFSVTALPCECYR